MAVTGIGTYASYTNSYGNTQNAGNKTGRTEPISTAELNGQKVFLIKIAGKLKIKLLVPKTALSSYKEALCSTEGEYAEVSANTPEGFPPEYALIPSIVEPTNMLGKSMLSGVKDFSKYDKP